MASRSLAQLVTTARLAGVALAAALAFGTACSGPAPGAVPGMALPTDASPADDARVPNTRRGADTVDAASVDPDVSGDPADALDVAQADTDPPPDGVNDDALADSAVADSALADSAVADSAVADSAVADSAVADSAVADSAATDAGQPDAVPQDSAVEPDAVQPDTAPADTVIVCIDVPLPAPLDEALLPTLQPVSAVQTVQSGGHTDDFLSNAAGDIRVGIRRDWGASIIFWGQQAAGTNTIDANDTGREVQVAFYDPTRIKQGCAWNASCVSNPATQCPNSITYLGWNPVQGGNECNVGSGVESVAHVPGLLSADVRPLFWNPDWQQQGCGNDGCSNPATQALLSDVRYVQRIRFVHSHIAEIDMTVHNLSGQDHPATLQELPTLYAAFGKFGLGNYNVLLTSDGQQVQIDEPANDGFFAKSFSSPGGWATLQNGPKNYGVGLYHENRQQSWQGWQKAGVFNNFRAQFTFGIPANLAVRARAYLMLGSAATIAGLAAWLEANLPPFGTIDAPAAEAQVSGPTLHIAGWTLDNKAVTSLQVEIDGVIVATPPLAVPRPDVCQVWPGYAMCSANVGFSVDVPTAGLSPCWHLLEVRAQDADGNVRLLGRRRFAFGG